jgi:fructokinase
MTVYGGIEAGGTKVVCAVGTGPDDIRAETRFPTTTPEETINRAAEFFEGHPDLAAIGIGSFGPLDLHSGSPTWGYITATPKRGWSNTDLAGPLKARLKVPVAMDTDVNAAALAEGRWGAARGLANYVYLTVGTGIGGGTMVDGRLVHGLMHPEMGHIFVPHDRQKDPFLGACPYHGDCLEGLASGPAIEARWGTPPETLPPTHPAWQLEAEYLAYGLVNIIVVLAPERIIVGGGVMAQAGLMPRIRSRVQQLLQGYLQLPAIRDEIEDYVVPPALGDRSGVLGGLALAESALRASDAQSSAHPEA